MKVTLLPVETAGYVAGLENGLLSLGVKVRAAIIERHPARYPQVTPNPQWAEWVAILTELKNNSGKSIAPVFYAFALVLRVFGSMWVAARSDHVILNNGRSLLPLQLDLLLYKAFGIRIIAMMGHGSEIRPACIDSLGETQRFFAGEIRRIHRRCKKRKAFVRRVESWSNLVISTPSISHYLSKSFVNGHLLGIPVSMPGHIEIKSSSCEGHREAKKLRVVHVPSAPNSKGTKLISDLCSALESEGLIEFRIASQVTHREALQLLSDSDVLLDQAYSDIYMPVLATEAAFLGKPAIVAGYAWDYLDNTSSRISKPPVINVLPDDLEATLRGLSIEPETLRALGEKAEKFVSAQRTPDIIAEKYLRLLSDDRAYIEEMKVNPGQPPYLWGCGSSRQAIEALARDSRGLHACF